jgi:glycosyltransferase involved in cell wall biosynthesis
MMGLHRPRVGIICPSDFAKRERTGGASGFVVSILPEFKSPVKIFGMGTTGTLCWDEIVLSEGVEFIAVARLNSPPMIPMRLSSFLAYLRHRARILRSEIDVLYIHSPECALPFIFSNSRVPVIFHQHGSGNPLRKSKFRWARNDLLIRVFDMMQNIIHMRADWVIAIDRLCVEQVNRNGAGNKVTLLMNAVDTNKFAPNYVLRAEMRKRFGIADNDAAVLFVGRLEEIKRVDRIIDAFQRLNPSSRSYHLYLAGKGTLKQELEEHVREKQLEKFVTFLGHVHHDELPGFYNMADTLVLPSEMEGVPMVILEALACGTPVVATKVGGIPDLVTSGANGILLEDVSPEDIASAIKEVCSRSTDRQIISRSMEPFSAVRAVAELKRIMRELLRARECEC